MDWDSYHIGLAQPLYGLHLFTCSTSLRGNMLRKHFKLPSLNPTEMTFCSVKCILLKKILFLFKGLLE